MDNRYYILDGHEPIPCSILEWEFWYKYADRSVAKTYIKGCEVSTVFLGLDHNFYGDEPLLFETMVFGGPLDQEQSRYSTWKEAEAGHILMCNRVKLRSSSFLSKLMKLITAHK